MSCELDFEKPVIEVMIDVLNKLKVFNTKNVCRITAAQDEVDKTIKAHIVGAGGKANICLAITCCADYIRATRIVSILQE